jgi:hypothetical protein
MIGGDAFAAIEGILDDYGIPIPEGRGWEKLEAMRLLVERSTAISAMDKQRVRNLLATG